MKDEIRQRLRLFSAATAKNTHSGETLNDAAPIDANWPYEAPLIRTFPKNVVGQDDTKMTTFCCRT